MRLLASNLQHVLHGVFSSFQAPKTQPQLLDEIFVIRVKPGTRTSTIPKDESLCTMRTMGGQAFWRIFSMKVLECPGSRNVNIFNIVQKPKWHSDALDIPDIFWNMPNYEPLYIMAAKIQDIKSRQNICPYFPFLHMSSVYSVSRVDWRP